MHQLKNGLINNVIKEKYKIKGQVTIYPVLVPNSLRSAIGFLMYYFAMLQKSIFVMSYDSFLSVLLLVCTIKIM